MKLMTCMTLRHTLMRLAVATFGLLLSGWTYACPDPYASGEQNLQTVYSHWLSPTIYFCKQTFNDIALSKLVTAAELGVTQPVVAMGDTSRSTALPTSSIDLAGFAVPELNLQGVAAEFPSENGAYGSKSLFNFYTRVTYRPLIHTQDEVCYNDWRRNQFTYIRDYLRSNPGVFVVSGATEVSRQAINDGSNDLLRIKVRLRQGNSPDELPATVTLYHANNQDGQWFTRNSGVSPRYCWVGVGARMSIDGNEVKRSGDYGMSIGVNVQ